MPRKRASLAIASSRSGRDEAHQAAAAAPAREQSGTIVELEWKTAAAITCAGRQRAIQLSERRKDLGYSRGQIAPDVKHAPAEPEVWKIGSWKNGRSASSATDGGAHYGLPGAAESVSGKAFGLVDEHDRNIFLDGVAQFAGVADEPVLRVSQVQAALAFGAGENVKQVLAYRHREILLGFEFAAWQLRGRRCESSGM
jgi:hypothetical protein